jgi:hypothetical protein
MVYARLAVERVTRGIGSVDLDDFVDKITCENVHLGKGGPAAVRKKPVM